MGSGFDDDEWTSRDPSCHATCDMLQRNRALAERKSIN